MGATTTYSGGVLKTVFDYDKLFIGNNRYITATFTNGTGAAIELSMGRLMGRIYSTALVTTQVSSATNGSQVPLGVLADDYIVAAGTSETVSICVGGDVSNELLIFGGSDTLTTAITLTDSGSQTVGIGIISDILVRGGFNIISNIQNTQADN